ncbi:unnamed protein product [Absidia cylindrospora]
MNKLLLGLSIEYYPQYDDNKLTHPPSAVYSGAPFYPNQSTFPLPNSPDSYASTKTSLSHSPSNAVYSMNPPPLFTSTSSSTTATANSSTTMNDMIATNETSPFYPELYTTSGTHPSSSSQDLSFSTENQQYQTPIIPTLSIPLVTSSPVSTSYSGTSSSPRSSISPATSMPCPTLNLMPETGSAYEGTAPSSSSMTSYQDYEMNSPSTSPQSLSMANSNSTNSNNNTTELRRQIHIQSEQKRRAQIKCGFEELRNELPTCLNKKMSKVALLHRTVQHIQHLKSSQITILTELERLVQENEQLKRFQQTVVQKQVMDNMYPIQ